MSSLHDPESPVFDDKETHFHDADDRSPVDGSDKPIPLSKKPSIAETLPLPHEILFVSVVVLAQFTAQTGLAQTVAILHVIGRHFGLQNPSQLPWLIAGYSLTIGSFILISGRLGDMFGYKRMLIIGFSWFSLWSMIAGLSVYSNHVLFVFARVFQGIGPAITLPNGLALLGATYHPGKRKDMIFAIFGATAPGESSSPGKGSWQKADQCIRWCYCWSNLRQSLLSGMVAVGLLVFRDHTRHYRSRCGVRDSRSTTKRRRRTKVGATEGYRSRSAWGSDRYHSTSTFQLCLEPGSDRRMGASICLRPVDCRSALRRPLLLH